MKRVKIIGAGLAGCEAAYQLSKRGIECILCDIKPNGFTKAHSNPDFGELVCSNSLKSLDLDTASGVLKQELIELDSVCIKTGMENRLENGNTLTVDRKLFASSLTDKIKSLKNVEFVCKEISEFNLDETTIIASGPLTTPPLMNFLREKLNGMLSFYDAAAPIISAESIDFSKTFLANRYDKGEAAYINCPLNKEQYEQFIYELINAECALKKEFEKSDVFEGCMPVEAMASRGTDTLRFGPLKPVGLYDGEGKRHYAVVQLRKENALGQMYNMVGFQTNLKFDEQKRVFGLIPALKNAEFLRFGVMHRNSFVDAPNIFSKNYRVRDFSNVFIAGQLSGVEGYCESIMSGLIAALSVAYGDFDLPNESITGALTNYLTGLNKHFQPMNANFGLLPPLDNQIRNKDLRRKGLASRAINSIQNFVSKTIKEKY